MPPKAQKEIVFKLEDQEKLLEVTAPDYPKLVLIDFYLEWCGPCEVMMPNYRTLYFGYDTPDQRMEIYQVNKELIPAEWLDVESDHLKKGLEEQTYTCRPKFIVFFEGEIKGVVDGADYTKIAEIVDTYIPSVEQD